MRKSILWLVAPLMGLLVFVEFSVAQTPPDRGRPFGPGGRGGPPDNLERALDDLKLSKEERDTALEAVRAHRDNVRSMTDLAGASLLLKMKAILSPEEYKKLQEATDKARVGPRNGRSPTVDDVVERIMSFDKNKDGKITKDELPERLQNLIEKGDTNKDGALDKDEIKKLAVELANDRSLFGVGAGRGGAGGRVNPGGGLFIGMIERAVDDLKLPEGRKEKAAAAVKALKEDARKLTEMARASLLVQMSEVLSEEETKKIKGILDRQPGVGERLRGPNGPPFGRGGPPRP
jgi:EF hand